MQARGQLYCPLGLQQANRLMVLFEQLSWMDRPSPTQATQGIVQQDSSLCGSLAVPSTRLYVTY